MAGMAGRLVKIIEIDRNGKKKLLKLLEWQEITGNDWTWLKWQEWLDLAFNTQNLLEMTENGQKWLEMAGICWNMLKKA